MADEPVLAAQPLHDVVQDLRENADDAIALVVRVAVVELLEVIEVGVARREAHAGREAPRDLGLDLDRAGQPRRRMHDEIAIGAAQHRVEARDQLGVAEPLAHALRRRRPRTPTRTPRRHPTVSITAGTTPV